MQPIRQNLTEHRSAPRRPRHEVFLYYRTRGGGCALRRGSRILFLEECEEAEGD